MSINGRQHDKYEKKNTTLRNKWRLIEEISTLRVFITFICMRDGQSQLLVTHLSVEQVQF